MLWSSDQIPAGIIPEPKPSSLSRRRSRLEYGPCGSALPPQVRKRKSRRLATVVSGAPVLFLLAKSYLLRLLTIHPTKTTNEHADVASEVAKEVTEVIIIEQQGGLSGGLKGAHPNPPENV